MKKFDIIINKINFNIIKSIKLLNFLQKDISWNKL